MHLAFSSILLSSFLGPASSSLIRSAIGNPENDFMQYLVPHDARRLQEDDGADISTPAANEAPTTLRGHRKLANLKVGDSSVSGCSASYATINEALTSTTANDITIELCEGTFDETVIVEPGLKLKILGQGQGLSTIRAPDVDAPASVIRALNETEVELEDLTLDGANRLIAPPPATRPPQGPFVQGFYCDRCDAKLKKVDIINIVSPNADGWAEERPFGPPGFRWLESDDLFSFGVQIVSTVGEDASNKVRIEQSNLSGVNRAAISVQGPTEVEIIENTLTMDPNPDTNSFPFSSDAILTFLDVKAKVIKNTILNTVTGPPPLNPPFPGYTLPASSGILFDCPASGSEIKENIVIDSDIGITLDTASDVKVEMNTITNVEGGINVETGAFPCDEGFPTAEKNEIRANTITNSMVAIVVRNNEYGGFGEDPANAIIKDNTIESNFISNSAMAAILVEFGQDETIKNNQVVEPMLPPTEEPEEEIEV